MAKLEASRCGVDAFKVASCAFADASSRSFAVALTRCSSERTVCA